MKQIVCFLILYSYSILSAIAPQDNTGTIKGVVLNAEGKPAPAASVLLTVKQVTVTTDEHGIFTISNLQPGSYELVVSLIGHATVTHTVKITAGKTSKPAIALKIANKQLQHVVDWLQKKRHWYYHPTRFGINCT